MNKSEPTPIQRLRQEKRRLRELYTQDEKRLAEDWEYLTDNIGYLAFNSVVKGAKDSFLPSLLAPRKDTSGKGGALNILMQSMPLIWEIAQPMLVGYLVKRVKNMFSSKKKRKE